MKKFLIATLYLFLSIAHIHSQQALELSGSAGVSLDASQMNLLQEVATSIQPNFKPGVSFNIYDCSFYTFNDEMGAAQEAAVWESFQKQASVLGENYLLLGRQITAGSSGFKLWIKLSVNASDLECYEVDLDKIIQDNIEAYQINLEEWYEFLLSDRDISDFEIMVEIADLTSIKIDKVCCSLEGSRSACDDVIDPQEIENLRGRKIYIISKLQCLLFSNGGCEDAVLDPASGLGLLDETLLDQNINSTLRPTDKFYLIGYMQIFYPEWSVDNIFCGIVADDEIYEKEIDGTAETVEMKLYHIGKISILIEADKDLYQIIQNINTKLNNDIKELKEHVKNDNDAFFNINDNRDFVRYANTCNFQKLEKGDRLELLTVILEFDKYSKGPWYYFWSVFDHQTPVIARNLYDSFGEEFEVEGKNFKKKPELFNYLQDNLETTVFLLEYGFPLEMKKAFLKDFSVEYTISMLSMEDDKVLVNGEEQKLVYLPYEIEKGLGFYINDYKIIGDNYKVDGKFHINHNEKILKNTPNGGTYYVDNWVEIASVDAFAPVMASNINVEGYSELPMIVPTVMLFAMGDFLSDENLLNGLSLSFDAATSLFAIGNVLKIRRGAGAIQMIFAGIEIASSVAGNIIKYSNLLTDENLKNEILFYLAMLELGSSFGTSFPTTKSNAITSFGVDKIQDLKAAENATDPGITNLISALVKTLGKNGLLLRLEALGISVSHTIYTTIKNLDNTIYKNTINQLNELSDATILTVKNNLTEIEMTYLFNDLNKFNAYSDYAQVMDDLPEGVKAFERMTGSNNAAARATRTNPESLDIIDEYMYEYPDKVAAIKQAFAQAEDKQKYVEDLLGPGLPNTYVLHRVRQLYPDIDPLDKLNNTFIDDFSDPYVKITNVKAIEGKNGHFVRVYHPEINRLDFVEGYILGAPSKIDNGKTPLILGEGIPTQMLVTLRQIKSLKIPLGSLQSVKLSTIQNKYTILWLAKILDEQNGITHYSEIGNLIFTAPKKSLYAIPTMKQAGYRVKSGALTESTNYIYPTTETTVGELLKTNEFGITQQDLIDFGLSKDMKTYFNFNIIFELESF